MYHFNPTCRSRTGAIRGIHYPLTSDPREILSIGCNGSVQTAGVAIFPGSKSVTIIPLNSRGIETRCAVALSWDPEVLRELAAVLNELAEEHEKT